MTAPADGDTGPSGGPPDAEVGRIIVERRSSPLALWILGLVLATATLLLVPGASRRWFENLVAVTVLAAVAIAWHTLGGRIRCGERGVDRTGLLGRSVLTFEEMGSVAYFRGKIDFHGIPLGGFHYLRVRPIEGRAGDAIFFSTCYWDQDERLVEIRDRLLAVLEARMMRELADRGQVQWTENLRILREGIEYRPAGFWGRLEPVQLPLDDLQDMTVDAYHLYLWRRGERKPVFREMLRLPNALAGHLVVEALLRARR